MPNPTPDTSELDKFMQEIGYVLADNIVGEFDHYIDYHDQSWIPVKTATKMFNLINHKLAKELENFCGHANEIPESVIKDRIKELEQLQDYKKKKDPATDFPAGVDFI